MIVRRARPGDEAALAALYREMQAHYDSSDPPGGADASAAYAVGSHDRQPFALVAEQDGTLLGFANLTPMFYGTAYQWLLFLKDVFVGDTGRGTGAGTALLRAIARVARDEGYCRVDWTTDPGNVGAQRLYDRLGVRREEKVFYRLAGADLLRLAADD
jgi:GNAT superfamily N-acetyltransferase